MIAINQVLTPKTTKDGGIVDEASADPEIPFANTLDDLMEGSIAESEAGELLLTELEADPMLAELEYEESELNLLQENILETLTDEEKQIGLAVPITPELLPNSIDELQLQNGESFKERTGMSRLEVLQQGKPLTEESLLVPELRTDTKALKNDLAKQQTTLGQINPEEVLTESKSSSKAILNETSSAHPFSNMEAVFQKTQPLAESGEKMEQMQAVLKQQFRSGDNEAVQTETLQEQILNAGLIKPGEQVQATVSRAPIETRLRISSEQTESAFSMKSGLEPVPGLEPGAASNNFQSQLVSRTEGSQQAQAGVQAPELPFDVEQIMSRVRVLRENDSQQITLKLQPEHLGQVTMKVRQSGGELQVDMRVDNMMAKQIIESGFDNLKSRFLDQELSYDQLSLNIEVDQRSASQYDRDQQNSKFGEETASTARGETEEEIVPDLINRRSTANNSESALNIYV